MRFIGIKAAAAATLVSLPLLAGCAQAHETYGRGGYYNYPGPYVHPQPYVVTPGFYGYFGKSHYDHRYRHRDHDRDRHARKDHRHRDDDRERARNRDRDRGHDGDRERRRRQSFEQRHPTPESLGIRPGDRQLPDQPLRRQSSPLDLRRRSGRMAADTSGTRAFMSDDEIGPAVLARLKEIAGPGGWLDRPADTEGFLVDERRLYRGASPLVLRPDSTAAVAGIVAACAEAGVGVVPQGGNTGYVGGGVPDDSGRQVVVSLSRMRRVREVDPVNDTMTVEAGCVLADIQAAAERAGRLFPLSLGAEGSCQIGGNLSTNAGGVAVLRYGNARDLVLGLEVVLPDGRIWDGLRALRKDNRGYDLKQLFLGAEGTLGIITAAVLKLYPLPRQTVTVMAAVPDPEAALELLAGFRAAAGERISSFEYLARSCLDLVLAHVADTADPFAAAHPGYVLVELASGRVEDDLAGLAEAVLGEALEAGRLADAVIAASEAQARALWRLRETIPEAQKHAGGSIKHDISVPASRIPELIARGSAAARAAIPGVRVIPFGHLGDGNIHFNLSQPEGDDPAAFAARTAEITPEIHDLAAALGGSFSAEHGIGRLKKAELRRYKSEVELDLMARLKQALDPAGVMNPGKLL